MLSESTLRRDDFAGGVPIVLGDGQEWHFPLPVTYLVPEIGPDGRVRAREKIGGLGPDYDQLLDEFYDAEPGQIVDRMMTLAVALLRANYRLEAADFVQLLRFRADDDATVRMWREIMEVAQGIAPKPSAPGESPTS